MADPTSRFSIAFNQPSLQWDVEWTSIDSHPNLLTSYTIDRGRQYELDRTDTGRATVQVADSTGILDPYNPDGPYFGEIEPLLQAAIMRHNPVTDEWEWRYRGFVEDYNYTFDPSQRVYRLEVTLVDLFEILSAINMVPGSFGLDPSAVASDYPDSVGQIVFENQSMQDRIQGVLLNAWNGSSEWENYAVVFSGNVDLQGAPGSVYSPGETPMDVIQEAADGEFPGVSNVFCDRRGRLCVHGRLAKFDISGVLAGGVDWDWHEWHAGDGTYVNAAPDARAQIRRFAYTRGLSKIINSAMATPKGIADTDITGPPTPVSGFSDLTQAGQQIYSLTSIETYGYRSWEAQNLITRRGHLPIGTGTDALEETRRFATYYVANYSTPRNRITDIAFRSLDPADDRAAYLWNLMSQVDISDQVDVTVSGVNGAISGFLAEPYFVEGVHEQVQPLNPDIDDVTLSLDLSPKAYFDEDPWPD